MSWIGIGGQSLRQPCRNSMVPGVIVKYSPSIAPQRVQITKLRSSSRSNAMRYHQTWPSRRQSWRHRDLRILGAYPPIKVLTRQSGSAVDGSMMSGHLDPGAAAADTERFVARFEPDCGRLGRFSVGDDPAEPAAEVAQSFPVAALAAVGVIVAGADADLILAVAELGDRPAVVPRFAARDA
jgi:hypothetical protein